MDPDAELDLLVALGLEDRIQESPGGDLALEIDPGPSREQFESAAAIVAEGGEWCPLLTWDSDAERRFAAGWVPEHLGSLAAATMVMQAPLEALVRGRGVDFPARSSSARGRTESRLRAARSERESGGSRDRRAAA